MTKLEKTSRQIAASDSASIVKEETFAPPKLYKPPRITELDGSEVGTYQAEVAFAVTCQAGS